jgi:hypothetical protein
MLRPTLALLAALVVVAACSASSGVDGSGPPGSSAPSTDDPGEPGSNGGASLPAAIIDPIVADAAARLGVDPSMVQIVAAEPKTYGDGSLGCPQPGEMYTQAVVDGYQVIVEANGTQLDYRGSGPGQFRVCEFP